MSDRIIIAMDVGTSLSAVSYLYSQPAKQTNKIQQAKSWPDQSAMNQGHASNVPTLMYYKDKRPCACGYTAKKELAIHEKRTTEGWHLVKEFKRHVHRLPTNHISSKSNNEFIDFPEGVTLEQIYEDYLGYLFKQSQSQIIAHCRVSERDDIWNRRIVVFVVSNGWSESEQSMLRRALVASGCVTAEKYVRFAQESEVALQSLLSGQDPKKPSIEFKNGIDFMVCDVGAATTDVAMYSVSKADPLEVREKYRSPSLSVEAGASLARETARNLLPKEKRANLQEIAKEEQAPSANTLPNAALKPHLTRIMEGIDKVKGVHDPKYLILGGGFFSEPSVRKAVREKYTGMKLVYRAHNESKSANAALECYLRNVVVARASSYAYGYSIAVDYDPVIPLHRERKTETVGNRTIVPGAWNQLVPYGEVFNDGKPYSISLESFYDTPYPDLSDFTLVLYAADQHANKDWVFDSEENLMYGFKTICVLKADFSAVTDTDDGIPWDPESGCYKLEFKAEVDFGSTTSRATIIWTGGDGEIRAEAEFEPPDSHVWKDDENEEQNANGKPGTTAQETVDDYGQHEHLTEAAYYIKSSDMQKGGRVRFLQDQLGTRTSSENTDFKWTITNYDSGSKSTIDHTKRNGQKYCAYALPGVGNKVSVIESKTEPNNYALWWLDKVSDELTNRSEKFYRIRSIQGFYCWTLTEKKESFQIELQPPEAQYANTWQWWSFDRI